MKTITVCTQKGGVGKTTTAATLAAGIARRGFRVLAVDTDPQHNLTSICLDGDPATTLSDAITGKSQLGAVIRPTEQGFDILPSDLQLSTQTQLVKLDTLRGILSRIGSEYDYCVIDTPPALSMFTMAAMAAASYIVIPAQPDVLSLRGLDQLSDTLDAIRPYNPDLQTIGVLLIQYSARRNIDRVMKESITERAQDIGATVYNTTIRTGVAAKEAQLLQMDLYTYAPKAGVTSDYSAFIDEFLKGVK